MNEIYNLSAILPSSLFKNRPLSQRSRDQLNVTSLSIGYIVEFYKTTSPKTFPQHCLIVTFVVLCSLCCSNLSRCSLRQMRHSVQLRLTVFILKTFPPVTLNATILSSTSAGNQERTLWSLGVTVFIKHCARTESLTGTVAATKGGRA